MLLHLFLIALAQILAHYLVWVTVTTADNCSRLSYKTRQVRIVGENTKRRVQ